MSPIQSHILLLGATGRVGQQVLTTALFDTHHITALVRNPASVPFAPNPNLTLIAGTPTSSQDIFKALRSIGATQSSSTIPTPNETKAANKVKVTIIFTLGQTRANASNPWSAVTSPAGFMAESAQAVVDALRSLARDEDDSSVRIEVERVVMLSMFGTAKSHANMHWLLRWTMAHSNMRQTLEDHDRVVEVVERNFVGGGGDDDGSVGGGERLEVPFVLVRPPMLKFGDEGEVPVVSEQEEEGKGLGLLSGCDVRSLAKWIVGRVGAGEEAARFDRQMPVVST